MIFFQASITDRTAHLPITYIRLLRQSVSEVSVFVREERNPKQKCCKKFVAVTSVGRLF